METKQNKTEQNKTKQKAGLAILIPDKIDFKIKAIKR